MTTQLLALGIDPDTIIIIVGVICIILAAWVIQLCSMFFR